jgi:hypothetical protein
VKYRQCNQVASTVVEMEHDIIAVQASGMAGVCHGGARWGRARGGRGPGCRCEVRPMRGRADRGHRREARTARELWSGLWPAQVRWLVTGAGKRERRGRRNPSELGRISPQPEAQRTRARIHYSCWWMEAGDTDGGDGKG